MCGATSANGGVGPVATIRKPRPVVEFLARVLPPPLFLRLYGLAKTRAWPNLRRPRRFTELLLRRMLDVDPETLVRTGDRYELRSFVVERLGEGYLPRLHDVIERGEGITPERVAGWPERAVLKASHASRWMRFVDRATADAAELDALVRGWTSRSYAGVRQERHYAWMAPRAVLEEDLSRDGEPPSDVKFYVFDGVPRLVMVESGRFRDLRRFVADLDWHPLDARYGEPPPDVDPRPPTRLAEMLAVAARLGAGFPFVRVDLYEVDGRVLVGEMTHFPGAGAPRFVPPAFDRELGAVWSEGRPIDGRWRRPSPGRLPQPLP